MPSKVACLRVGANLHEAPTTFDRDLPYNMMPGNSPEQPSHPSVLTSVIECRAGVHAA